jgi:hypothetical protein
MIGWKKRDASTYFSSFTYASELEFVTKNGHITEKGYRIYLSLLGVLGKHSVFGASPRKNYIWFEDVVVLKQLKFVKYDGVKYEYLLTDQGTSMSEVLARSLNNDGVPNI